MCIDQIDLNSKKYPVECEITSAMAIKVLQPYDRDQTLNGFPSVNPSQLLGDGPHEVHAGERAHPGHVVHRRGVLPHPRVHAWGRKVPGIGS